MCTQNFFIALVLMLSFASSKTLAYEEQALCPTAQSQDARTKFKALYEQGKYAQAEAFLSAYIDQCSDGMYRDIEPVSLSYWMVSDLMIAQQKTGHLNECLSRGLAVIHKWGWGEEIEKERHGKAMSAVKLNVEKCRSRLPSLRGVQFSSRTCPIKRHEHAVAIPPSWGMSDVEGMCIYFYPGKRLTGQEYENMPEDADTKKYSPYLVLLKSNGKGGHVKKKLPFVKGNLSEGEGCGSLKLELGGSPENRVIFLSGVLNFCWPGNASWALDAIYKFEPDRALLANEVVVGIH